MVVYVTSNRRPSNRRVINTSIRWNLVQRDIVFMKDDRMAWQVKFQPFMPNAPRADQRQAIQKTKAEAKAFSESYNVNTRTHQEGDWRLRERHFVVEYCKWERCSEADAKHKFKLYVLEQGLRWRTKEGEDRVAWRHPVENFCIEAGV